MKGATLLAALKIAVAALVDNSVERILEVGGDVEVFWLSGCQGWFRTSWWCFLFVISKTFLQLLFSVRSNRVGIKRINGYAFATIRE